MSTAHERFIKDKEVVSLARKIAEEYGDPDKETHNIPLYESFIFGALYETAYAIGMSYVDTELFRVKFTETLNQMSKESIKDKSNDQRYCDTTS
jgi:hypothetical protein